MVGRGWTNFLMPAEYPLPPLPTVNPVTAPPVTAAVAEAPVPS
jgi:hypothetical protein